MTFTDLLYFETISREESLTHAAQILYVSQPTLSKFLQRLESEVGVPLFEHIGKRVALTHAGRIYLSYVQKLLSIRREMDAAMLDIQRMNTGVLRVGMPPFRCSFAIPAVLPQFHSLYPQVEFSIMEASSETLDKALHEGSIDLAFFNLSERQPKLSYELIEKETLFAIVQKGHPIGKQALVDPQTGLRQIRLEWLSNETFILQNRTQRLGQYILHELEVKHIHPRRILESSNIRAAAYLASSGYGVSFLTGGLMRHFEGSSNFDCYSLIESDYTMYFVAAWRESSFLPKYSRDFIHLIREKNFEPCK